MHLTAELWNEMYPKGTAVRYWGHTVEDERPCELHCDTTTRSEAWDVGSQTIVLCKGIAGGLAVTHLMPLVPRKAETLCFACHGTGEAPGKPIGMEDLDRDDLELLVDWYQRENLLLRTGDD